MGDSDNEAAAPEGQTPDQSEQEQQEQQEPGTTGGGSPAEYVSPQDAIFIKMGLKKEMVDGDMDAFILGWCTNAHNSAWLEYSILTCILINTSLLMIQNPATTLSDDTLHIIMIMDYILTIIFTVEMFTHIIAMDFYNPAYIEGSPIYRSHRDQELGRVNLPSVERYLNGAWNQLDFVVVISSWVNILVEATGMELGIEVSTLRALRILRVLRSLRFFAGIKTILSVIAKALPYAANVLAFLGFLFVVCGIIGVQMFRGHTRSRCEYGSFALTAEMDVNKYPMIQIDEFANHSRTLIDFQDTTTWVEHQSNVSNITNSSRFSTDYMGYIYTLEFAQTLYYPAHSSPKPVGEMDPAYEYPIGIGVWTTYCTVDTDCPLFNIEGPLNRTQRCVPYGWIDDGTRNPEDNSLAGRHGNPGKGFQHFDNIFDAWIALFINMANLYWWETAHRIMDANDGLGSIIAWGYGLFNVLFLTYISVNMFVAVITTVFADVRSAENPDGGMVAKAGKGDRDYDAKDKWPKWNQPFYYVQAWGGPGGPYEARRRVKKAEQFIVAIETEQFELDSEFKKYMKKVIGQPALGVEKEKPPMNRDAMIKELAKREIAVSAAQDKDLSELDDGDLMDRLLKAGRDSKIEDDAALQLKKNAYIMDGLEQNGQHGLVNGSRFNNFIMLFILLNTITLAADYHNDSYCCVIPDGPGDYCTIANSKCTADVVAGVGNDLHTGLFMHHTRYPTDYFNATLAGLCADGATAPTEGVCDGITPPTLAGVRRYNNMRDCIAKNLKPEDMCQTEYFVAANKIINYIFNFVFTCEMFLKIFGMGFKSYIAVAFNKLDFFIVVTSSLDMLADAVSSPDDEASGAMAIFKLFRVFRLFRVLRVARFLYKNENLKRVLQTVFGSGEALGNLFIFITFSIMLFAILGMHLVGGNFTPHNPRMPGFGDNSGSLYGRLTGDTEFMIRHEGKHNITGYNVVDMIRSGTIPRRNFEDFPRAFLLAFQVMTGDDWVNQMNDYMEVYNGWLPPLLFFTNFAFCNFILLSLFIAVILENFAVAEAKKMDLQKHQFQTKQEKVEDDMRKPKVTFVHRLCWLVKAQGGRGLMGFDPELTNVDTTNGKILPPEFSEEGKVVESRFAARTGLSNKWYNDDKALFVLGAEHPLRVLCRNVASNAIFDTVVLVAIMIGTVILAFEGPPGYQSDLEEDLVDAFHYIGLVFYVIFLAEFWIKVLGFGFMFTPDAYIKDPWNKLDFIVITGSTLNILGFNTGIIALARCLRPLRIINRNIGMRIIITAVTQSLAVNLGVLALAGMGLLIFGILGVNLFGGKFYSCNCGYAYPAGVTPQEYTFDYFGNITNGFTFEDGPAPTLVRDKLDCLGPDLAGGVYGVDPSFPDAISKCYWDNRPYNFDTCGNAAMALFTASTLAGWTDIMEAGVDSGAIDEHPDVFRSSWASVYFLFYVLIMAFFVTNLFIGVLIDFIGHSDGTALLTEEQQKLIDMQKFQKLHRPSEHEKAPSNCIRKWFYGLVESSFWDKLSNGVIIFNVIVMMCEYQDMIHDVDVTLELLNTICLYFFTFEMAFKLIGYFPIKYIKDPWSKFDAVVVSLSWAAIFFEFGSVQAIRAMRAFRIVLVLKSAKGIRSLFQTLLLSVAPGVNITVLLLLLYSLYAILGMQLFGTAALQDIECMAPHDHGEAEQFYHGHLRPGEMVYLEELPAYCVPGQMVKGLTEAEKILPTSPASFAQLAGGKTGQYLFGLNRQYTHHANFQSFAGSLMLLVQCANGQDWKFVMYAVGGEPGGAGRESQAGVAFLFFFSFFFLSNYILLNLFIAVILDNFAASMREQALDISEADFETFKYMFRERTDDKSPETIQYSLLWDLLEVSGDTESFDEDGNKVENPFSPLHMTIWSKENETAWKLSRPRDRETVPFGDVKALFEALYTEGSNPIEDEDEVGEDFEGYWINAIMVPGTFAGAEENGEPDWHSYVNYARLAEADHADEAAGRDEIKCDDIKRAIQTMRFRANFKSVQDELDFCGLSYENPSSTLQYDQVLRAFVQNRMGANALTLEEQMARNPEQFGIEEDEENEDEENVTTITMENPIGDDATE